MGTQGLENNKRVAYFEYDYDKEGGAVGDITLDRGDKLPEGAIVTSGVVHSQTAVTSGGSATIALKLNSSGDVLAATAISNFTANALLDVVPDGTASNMVRISSAKYLTMTIATAALTAGKFVVALEYVMTE